MFSLLGRSFYMYQLQLPATHMMIHYVSVNRNITVFITLIITVSTKAKMFQLVLKLVFTEFFE